MRGYLDDDPYQFEKDLFDFLSQVKGQPIDTIEDPSVREIAKRMEGVIVPAPSQPTSADNELEFIGHMDAWDSDTPLDEDEVELPLFREVELAAGAGQTQVIENHGAKLRFAKSTLSRAGVVEENAACAFVRGNSMEPVMPDGTCVGVNTGDTAIRDGEIYAIDHDGMLRVKYLHRRPGGGIKIVSQNSSEHATEEYSAQAVIDNNIRVIGRVFWWSVLR
jgi:phage repressor protein C with HTH and peptisase S24 domain